MKVFFFLPLFLLCTSTMSNGKVRSHTECRKVLCAACGKKDNACFNVTPTIEALIQNEVSKLYRVEDTYLPNGVCGNCRKWLFSSKNGKIVPETVRDRWNTLDFNEFKAPSQSTPCSCNICKRVRFTDVNLEKSAQVDLPRKPIDKPDEAEARKETIWPTTRLKSVLPYVYIYISCLNQTDWQFTRFIGFAARTAIENSRRNQNLRKMSLRSWSGKIASMHRSGGGKKSNERSCRPWH